MTKMLHENFSKIPYHKLIDGLLEEMNLLEGKNNDVLLELEKQLDNYKRMIKRLLLVQEQFEYKKEIERLEARVHVAKLELDDEKRSVS